MSPKCLPYRDPFVTHSQPLRCLTSTNKVVRIVPRSRQNLLRRLPTALRPPAPDPTRGLSASPPVTLVVGPQGHDGGVAGCASTDHADPQQPVAQPRGQLRTLRLDVNLLTAMRNCRECPKSANSCSAPHGDGRPATDAVGVRAGARRPRPGAPPQRRRPRARWWGTAAAAVPQHAAPGHRLAANPDRRSAIRLGWPS